MKSFAQETETSEWQNIWAAIDRMDFAPIRFKLTDERDDVKWTKEFAAQVEEEYRRFLKLTAKYQGRSIATNKTVDTFWHAHILDTRKYAEDCEATFGYFLHHFPYFGMRSQQDAQDLANANDETRALYKREFNSEPWAGTTAWCAPEQKTAWCSPEKSVS